MHLLILLSHPVVQHLVLAKLTRHLLGLGVRIKLTGVRFAFTIEGKGWRGYHHVERVVVDVRGRVHTHLLGQSVVAEERWLQEVLLGFEDRGVRFEN